VVKHRDFVILDEAHYLGDRRNATRLEEAISIAAAHSLSFAVGDNRVTPTNSAHRIGWRGNERGVINRAGTRPVELRRFAPTTELFPLFDEKRKF